MVGNIATCQAVAFAVVVASLVLFAVAVAFETHALAVRHYVADLVTVSKDEAFATRVASGCSQALVSVPVTFAFLVVFLALAVVVFASATDALSLLTLARAWNGSRGCRGV